MPYSLISFTSVGFDLARLPHGDHVTRVLEVALGLEQEHCAVLAAAHRGDARLLRWQQVTSRCTNKLGAVSKEVAAIVGGHPTSGGPTDVSDVLSTLQVAPVGSIAALDNLIRRDILRWSWTLEGEVGSQPTHITRAADVLVDSAAAGFAGADISGEMRRAMAAPFAEARAAWRTAGTPVPKAPIPADVDAALSAFRDGDAALRDAWREYSRGVATTAGVWSGAMNQACWAVHTTDRVTTAASAQLALVTAFRSAGLTSSDAATGLWNTLSGAIQAMVVADVLGDEYLHTLLDPWHSVMGA